MPVQRFDRSPIRAEKTAEGFIEDSPIVGRVGILEYRTPTGIRREFRPPEEAFHADSLASLRGKPVTVGHPGIVRADNVKAIQPIGTVLSVGQQDGDNIRADMVIYNLDTGGRELSCGYQLDLDETPGEWNGQHYDAIQRNIRYNHVAVVPSGRAGPIARLNMDSNQINDDEEEEKTMPKIRLDNGLEYDASQEVVVAFEKLRNDHVTLTGNHQTIQQRLDTTEAERDTLKAKVDGHATELENVRKDSAAKLQEAVKARVGILASAAAFKIDKADEMTDRQIKEAVIKVTRGDAGLDLSQKSDAYIEAAFDMVQEDGAQREDAMAAQRKAAGGGGDKTPQRQDNSSVSARERMIESMETAYKGGEE